MAARMPFTFQEISFIFFFFGMSHAPKSVYVVRSSEAFGGIPADGTHRVLAAFLDTEHGFVCQ
jgi:hypothetical protein